MAWAQSGVGAHDSDPTSLQTLTIPASTVGNLGVLCFSFDPADSVPAPTGGGTWARLGAAAQHDATHGQDATWFWTVFTSSVTTLTLAAGTMSAAAVCFAEFTPPAGTVSVDDEDATLAFFTSSTTPDANTSNDVVASSANELLVSAIYDQNGSVPTFSAGTNFSLAVTEPGLSTQTGACALEWKESASGSQHSTWTMNLAEDGVTIQAAIFLPSSGGGGTEKAGTGIIGP